MFSVDDSPEWYARVQEQLAGRTNVDFVLETDLDCYTQAPQGQFDVVILDGGIREHCGPVILDRLVTEDSLIIIDNSEGYPILAPFTEAGWARIDFHGFAAGVWRQQCTSLLFRSPRWFQGLAAPERKYEVAPGTFNGLRRPWQRTGGL